MALNPAEESKNNPVEGSTEPTKEKKRFAHRHLSILPNACTSMNLFCGYLSIVMTSRGEFLLAGWLILVANVFDILDGRLARLTSVTSRFGAELDSLADLVSFGVAPAFLVYTRYLDHERYSGLIVSAIFMLCGALRLARFNITPPSKHDVFEGLPIPAGAGILATMTIFELQFFNFIKIPNFIIPVVVLVTSFLMVSKIEYPAMKKTPQTSGKRKLMVLLGLIALFVNPPMTLFFISWGFALYGLTFGFVKSALQLLRRFKKKPADQPQP
ncbi:MAG: CDP-diacylglycerol--serine O-phosphatidyltransferase [Candidatus Rifleibacteriota bacterium]